MPQIELFGIGEGYLLVGDLQAKLRVFDRKVLKFHAKSVHAPDLLCIQECHMRAK